MIEEIKHHCAKTQENGKRLLSYFDKDNRVCYCHYCGEHVTADEYTSYLLEHNKALVEALEDVYDYIKQTDQELTKRRILKALTTYKGKE